MQKKWPLYTTRKFSHENSMKWQQTREMPHENGFMGINQCYGKHMKNIMPWKSYENAQHWFHENPMKLLPHEFAMKDQY